jgi:glycosyltransferase involved in cell wall biosynthesis
MNGLSVLVALRSRWAFGTPIVLSEHGVYLRERYLGVTSDAESHAVRWLTVRFHRALARTGYRIADILAPHSAFNRRWQLYNGGQPERVETMYNGIDPAQFPIAEDEPEVPTIVFVGRIDPLKDVHTLLRSFALVRAGLPQARLRIFGPVTRDNEGYHESCVRLAEDLGLAGAVTFEGRIPQVVDAYRAGHVVALTSTSEGFPYTIVEAMSVGRPTVATDVGGVSEAVGDAGFVVPPRDPEAIAQACLTLLADPALRREMGERARRRVLELFTLRQWTEAYRDIYELLSGPMRSRQVELPVASAADAEAVVTDVPA